ncbi:phage tail protein, partial [Yersinia enterocolitica]
MQKIGDIPNTRADNNGEFTDGNVAGGVPPTILPAEWFNTIQRELISVLSAAGITPDSNKFDQVSKAVSKLITDGGFLKTANNLSEIANAGPAAVAKALANLGLGDAAKRSVGTGVGQIPDMSSFISSFAQNGYFKFPGGLIIQWGEVTGSTTATVPANFPIPFPNALMSTALAIDL